jgi:hypothetical protein
MESFGILDISLWYVICLYHLCSNMSRKVTDKYRHDMRCNALFMRMYRI